MSDMVCSSCSRLLVENHRLEQQVTSLQLEATRRVAEQREERREFEQTIKRLQLAVDTVVPEWGY